MKENIQYLFCDLDGTLIKTISGKTFAEDVTDFRIRKEVLDKIKELNEVDKLAFIAIVTNQGGIPQYVSENDFYAKLTAIKTFVCQYTKVPMVVADYCISLDADNEYRKPNTGMLSRVVSSYENNSPSKFVFNSITNNYERVYPGNFRKENALMIGDASGKEGQWSDTDKKTAENFGIDYMDVEDFIHTQFK